MISDSPVNSPGVRTEEAVTKVREGAGWIELDHLSLIRVSGPPRVKFLHNLLSNDINGLAEGHTRMAALMNLKGHQIAWMRVMADQDALICELTRGARDTVVDTFLHFKVGAPVRFEKVDAVFFGLFGARAGDSLQSLGFENPPAEVDSFVTLAAPEGGLRAARGRDLPAGGYIIHAEPKAAGALKQHLRDALGETLDPAVLETMRVEEGLPWHGVDVKEENLLHETGQLSVYHSPSKGCYLGQEVVARLEGRGGHVNRRLRGLKCASPAKAGDRILAGDKEVGEVTSAGLSPVFGPIAMGYVHRSQADEGTEVQFAGGTARVIELPFTA